MPDHSPEPWKVREVPDDVEPDGYCRIVDRNNRHVCTVPYSTPTIQGVDIDGHANKDRITACVNACQGFDNDILESVAEGRVIMYMKDFSRTDEEETDAWCPAAHAKQYLESRGYAVVDPHEPKPEGDCP